MDNRSAQSSKFRRDLIAYFAENKNMIRKDLVIEDTDHMIMFKQDASANFYDIVIPMDYVLGIGDTFRQAILLADLTIDIAVGNLTLGHTYPAGTPLETLWRDMVTLDSISGLVFSSYRSLVEVGTTVIPNEFRWNETGTVGLLTLSDTEGNSQDAVIPEVMTWTHQYVKSSTASVVWTLSSNIISYDLSLTTKWIYPSYYGISLTLPITIYLTHKLVIEVNNGITVDLNTTNTEYGWVAVPASNPIYTKWIVNEFNQGDIGAADSTVNFILYTGITQIASVDYHLYNYAYPSELVEPIRLY